MSRRIRAASAPRDWRTELRWALENLAELPARWRGRHELREDAATWRAKRADPMATTAEREMAQQMAKVLDEHANDLERSVST